VTLLWSLKLHDTVPAPLAGVPRVGCRKARNYPRHALQAPQSRPNWPASHCQSVPPLDDPKYPDLGGCRKQ
jgi:hypothetical protein